MLASVEELIPRGRSSSSAAAPVKSSPWLVKQARTGTWALAADAVAVPGGLVVSCCGWGYNFLRSMGYIFAANRHAQHVGDFNVLFNSVCRASAARRQMHGVVKIARLIWGR